MSKEDMVDAISSDRRDKKAGRDIEKASKPKKKFSIIKFILTIILLLVLVAAGYVGYVYFSYSRIPDNQELTVYNCNSDNAEVGKEYTVVSYNVGFGAYTDDFTFFMDGGSESRARSEESVKTCINGCSDIVLSYDPDFVIFQEVDTDSTRSHHVDESALIRDSFMAVDQYDNVFAQNYHSAYLMYPITEPHGASNSGLMTLSRFKITSSLRRSLPIATDFNKLLDLDRCYSISRIPTDDCKELILIDLHLSAYGTDASQGNAQLEMLFEDMKKEYDAGNYVIAGGDFNHDFTCDSKEYFNPGNTEEHSWCNPFPDDIIPDGFSKCTDYAEGMVASTRNTDIPYSEDSFTVILDGFIVSDNVTVNYVQNIDKAFKYTDHNPVVMKFVLGTAEATED